VTGAAPVRWGFLGAGSIARTALGPAVAAAPNAVLHAAAARDPARAAALGPVRSYGDYAELLADDDVEAVYVALHNDAHLPWTLAALEAGKHVLCEKPLGLDAGEVDRMAAAAGDRLVVEASWYRWHPRVRLAQARLPELGAVQHVAAGFTSANDLEGTTGSTRRTGGGALYDVGCYAVSACLWAVGRGLPRTSSPRERRPTASTSTAARLLARGAPASRPRCTRHRRDLGQWLVITGERGELELRGRGLHRLEGGHRAVGLRRARHRARARPAADAYAVMVEEVSSVLRGGPGWVLPLAESRQTAAVLDAAFASADAAGAPVAVRGPE
jgi:predicted dehydrogenase